MNKALIFDLSDLTGTFQSILVICLILLAALIVVAVIRSILGPKTTDRIIAVNMIGTLTMVMIVLLTVYLGEDYLVDVCLIYAMMSFLAVVVLTKIYTGMYRARKLEAARKEPAPKPQAADSEKEEG